VALIVEDGSQVSGAESYISLTAAAAYHSARGNAAWAALASDTVREQLLRKATDYMIEVYRQAWQGRRVTATQALDWPRYGVYLDGFLSDDDFVPVEVQNACAVLALKAQSGPLVQDTTQTRVRVKVGPIETEFDPYSPQTKRYTSIDRMLAPFLTYSGVSARLVRS
jgi:hypothetical protein